MVVQPNTTGYPSVWYHGGVDFAGATPVDLSAGDLSLPISVVATHVLSGLRHRPCR